MSCPACGQALASGRERCPSCGAVVAPPVEGALAPDPASATPPGRGRGPALRDLPARRGRERSWKDEVKDRVESRRQQRGPGLPPRPAARELPLFGDTPAPADRDRDETEPPVDAGPAPAPGTPSVGDPTRRRVSSIPVERQGAAASSPLPAPVGRVEGPGEPEPEVVEERELRPPEGTALADLPLHPSAETETPSRPPREAAHRDRPDRFDAREAAPSVDDPIATAPDEWGVEILPRSPEPAPLERPAFAQERAQAAALDLALLGAAATVVVYFAGRAARVSLEGLLPAWPWLLAYLAFLGLVYGGYFTGATGQTPGKMAIGLRVVDHAGGPPGFVLAFVRAAAGALGVLLAGLGLVPMLFDPARRAAHDRLFRMRVLKR